MAFRPVVIGIVVASALKLNFDRRPLGAESRVTDACGTGLTVGDTVRFVGVTRNHRPAGAMRIWADTIDRIRYAESWRSGDASYDWDGEIDLARGATPLRVVWRAKVNGALRSTQTVERVGDSVVVLRLQPVVLSIEGNTVLGSLARNGFVQALKEVAVKRVLCYIAPTVE